MTAQTPTELLVLTQIALENMSSDDFETYSKGRFFLNDLEIEIDALKLPLDSIEYAMLRTALAIADFRLDDDEDDDFDFEAADDAMGERYDYIDRRTPFERMWG